MWPRLIIIASGLAASIGCGYGWVGPAGPSTGDAPSTPVRLGDVRDTTAEGDLGLLAGHRLRLRLSAAGRLAEQGAHPRLSGVVRAIDDPPLAFDRERRSVARITGVELELWLSGADGARTWSSGLIRISRPWLRGDEPAASRAHRRAMMMEAVDEAVDEALRRLGRGGPARLDGEAR